MTAAAVVLTGACTSSSPPPPAVNHGRIERIVVIPHPEGIAFGFVRPSDPKWKTQLALAEIQSAIPDPLPAPIAQGQCSSGHTIKIEFQDGASVEYGPCRKPRSLDRLDAAIAAAVAVYERRSCARGQHCRARGNAA